MTDIVFPILKINLVGLAWLLVIGFTSERLMTHFNVAESLLKNTFHATCTIIVLGVPGYFLLRVYLDRVQRRLLEEEYLIGRQLQNLPVEEEKVTG